MNKQEFIEKYGEIEVTFSSYFKYVFYFRAILPNDHDLLVYIGGKPEYIYRTEVNGNPIKIVDLDAEAGLEMGTITDNEGETIDSYVA